MFPRCSKTFLTVLNRLPRLLNLCQRTDPVIVLCKNGVASCDVRLCSRGYSKRGPAGPLLVVSNREVLRRGRKRNLPLLSVVFFGSFLLDRQKKGTPSIPRRGGDQPPAYLRLCLTGGRALLGPTGQTELSPYHAPWISIRAAQWHTSIIHFSLFILHFSPSSLFSLPCSLFRAVEGAGPYGSTFFKKLPRSRCVSETTMLY